MKKVICIAAAVIFLFGSAAAAGQHTGIQCVFEGLLAGRIVSADLYYQENHTTAVSTLFPELAVIFENEGSAKYDSAILYSIRPETITEAVNHAAQILDEWLCSIQPSQISGLFAGNLFDHATSLSTYEFLLSDFISYCQELKKKAIIDEQENNDQQDNLRLLSVFYEILQQTEKKLHPSVLFRRYDDGRYYTIQLLNSQGTILTVSLDCTDTSSIRTVIGSREDGRYYFRQYMYRSEQEEQSIYIDTALYSGNSSSYQNAMREMPLFIESLVLTEEKDESSSFRYIFNTDILTDSIIATGNISASPKDDGNFNARVFISGKENESMNICMYTEPMINDVVFSDKTIKNLKDPKEKNDVQLAIKSGMMILAGEIAQILPQDYQAILLKLLFE